MDVPADLRYSDDHEWLRTDGSEGTVGITRYAADELGDVVFVELPRVGQDLTRGETFGVIESVKTASDLYAPVATQLGVDRATAKVAVLGAMYGQTTGHGAQVLPRLRSSYPVAMAYLEAGDRAGQMSQDLRTYGGRLVRMGTDNANELGDREARARAAARGRYGRNALVQGAAAEFFKVWAATVRARGVDLDARIVLCLHDELLVHAPVANAEEAAAMVDDALQEAAARWAPDRSVRFVADTAIITRWSDAKD